MNTQNEVKHHSKKKLVDYHYFLDIVKWLLKDQEDDHVAIRGASD